MTNFAARGSFLALVVALAACSSTTNGADVPTTDAVRGDVTATDVRTASDVPVATGDGGFACGEMTCNAATQYCQVLAGGTLPDGGRQDSYRCDSFDIVCTTDHTCACLRMNLKCSNNCTEPMGQVTTVCGI